MYWLVAGSIWGASISVLAWLLYRAPLLDENERPMASVAIASPSQREVRVDRRAVRTKPSHALARRLNSGRPPSPHRSFRLTR